MGCKPWGEALEQIWTLVCLLTVKTNGTTGTISVTQGSVLTEMSCCCQSHFKMEVRDFDRQEGRNKEGPQRWACKVSNSAGWKQRNKIIRDSAGGKSRKSSLTCQTLKTLWEDAEKRQAVHQQDWASACSKEKQRLTLFCLIDSTLASRDSQGGCPMDTEHMNA